MIERVPPQNLEAEQSVLGSMLIDREAVSAALEILKPVEFYREAHRVVYESMVQLFDQNEPVDLVTVSELLRQQSKLESIGGITYLSQLATAVPTAANVEFYAKIVSEKALLRGLISAATRIATLGYDAADDARTILGEAERLIFDVAQGRSGQEFAPIRDVLMATYEYLDQLFRNQGQLTGVPTGFADLDLITAGLQKSDLIILAARPSVGKTTLALNIAHNAAVKSGVATAIFSLEMSKEQVVSKMLCTEAQINLRKLRVGALEEQDWTRLTRAVGILSEAPIFIDDTPGLSITEIKAKTRRLHARSPLGLVIIDYMQLMSGGAKTENRQQEISEISRSLKGLARELNVPIVALSQLSRACEQRQDKRPMLSDLRESGSIEQDADIVAFVYRDDYYNPESEKKNIVELIIAKHRNGATGTVELYFWKELSKMGGLERHHGAE